MRYALIALLIACRSGTGDDGSGGGITPIALEVAPAPGGIGTMLLATVVVNGSAPIPVRVDTGSVGLRVFAADLAGVTVATTAEMASAELDGHVLAGHVASGTVQLGDVQLPADLTFQLVETGGDVVFTDAGIHGILGIGLRAGSPPSIYSPLAQLTGFTSYAIHTGGFGSTTGSIELAAVPRGYTLHDLAPVGALPDGIPAWADDAIAACYMVGGSPLDPPCTDTIVDSGSPVDVIAAAGLPTGALPDGTAFAVSIDPFTTDFTAGTTASEDLVTVDPTTPFAILGIELFLRHDVIYDLATGAIGFRSP